MTCLCCDKFKNVYFTKSAEIKPHDPLTQRQSTFYNIEPISSLVTKLSWIKKGAVVILNLKLYSLPSPLTCNHIRYELNDYIRYRNY